MSGKDSKTHLKELAERGQLPEPRYSSQRQGGPEHAPAWAAEVTLTDGRSAWGNGRSIVEAEKNAADALIQKYDLPT